MFSTITKRVVALWNAHRGPPQPLGLRGEDAAARFLRRKRYKIVARQDRVKLGEIDLVAVDGETIVFVEVKTRSDWRAGHPTESVTADKQRRITGAALAFLRSHNLLEYAARFDVVAVTWPKDAANPRIEHYEDAFEPTGNWQMFS